MGVSPENVSSPRSRLARGGCPGTSRGRDAWSLHARPRSLASDLWRKQPTEREEEGGAHRRPPAGGDPDLAQGSGKGGSQASETLQPVQPKAGCVVRRPCLPASGRRWLWPQEELCFRDLRGEKGPLGSGCWIIPPEFKVEGT